MLLLLWEVVGIWDEIERRWHNNTMNRPTTTTTTTRKFRSVAANQLADDGMAELSSLRCAK
jgi:hypothetical protein